MFKSISIVLAELAEVLRLIQSYLWRVAVKPPGFGDRVYVRGRFEMGIKVLDVRQGLVPPVSDSVVNQKLIVIVNNVARPPLLLERSVDFVDLEALPFQSTVQLILTFVNMFGIDSAQLVDSFIVDPGPGPDAPEAFGERTYLRAYEIDG